jgi:hypothetical protein
MRYKGKTLFGKDFSITAFRARYSLAMEWLNQYNGTGHELAALLAEETALDDVLQEWAASHPKQETFNFGPYWKG